MKKVLTHILVGSFLVTLLFSSPVQAAGSVEKTTLPTSPLYFLVKLKESVQQLVTFDQTAKAQLMERFSEQRIKEMAYAASSSNNKALNLCLERYREQKKISLGHVLGASDTNLTENINEKTLQQQKSLTQLQLGINTLPEIQQEIVTVQKEVAEGNHNVVKTVMGEEAASKTENATRYIWLDPSADANGNLPSLPDAVSLWEYAPGTEGRDNAGRVVEYTVAPGANTINEGGHTIEIQWGTSGGGTGEGGVVIEGGPQVVITGGGKGVQSNESGNVQNGGGNTVPSGEPQEVIINEGDGGNTVQNEIPTEAP